MKRLTLKLTIALLTCLIGVVITGLLTIHPFRSTEKIPVSSPLVAVTEAKVTPPDGWKKVDVNKMFTFNPEKIFSFYLPSDMREKERRDQIDWGRPPIFFVNKTLSFGYRLIDKEENKALWHGMMSCESWAEDHTGMTISRSSEVEIGGRRAIQAIWKLDNPTLHRMTLCFPEIEDGIILKLWAVSEDERSLDIAEQILGTIEFPQSKARSDK